VYRLVNGFALVRINHDPESVAERAGDKARVQTVIRPLSAPLPPSSGLARSSAVARLIGRMKFVDSRGIMGRNNGALEYLLCTAALAVLEAE